MAGPFKMKGSPMQRNFGIGESPVKQENFQKYMKIANKVNRAKGNKVSYKSAWDAMSKSEQAKHGNFANFKVAAKKWNEENPNYDKSKHDIKGGSIV